MTFTIGADRLLIAVGLGLLSMNGFAAEFHAPRFLSPNGQSVSATMLTADCHYRDTTGIQMLQRKSGPAGRVICMAPNGLKVATFSSNELYAERMTQAVHGGVVLKVADGRGWNPRSNRRELPTKGAATYGGSPCAPVMPGIS